MKHPTTARVSAAVHRTSRLESFVVGPLLATLVALAIALFSHALTAQWNPESGQWLKESATDLRVMTFNVKDGLCSSNSKVEGLDNWSALARIVASLKPDVLILQECADNSGNGTGSGVDSVTTLATTLNLFLHGGPDPFKPGGPPVTSYVQLYDPAYDLPHVFVSSKTDGFNRDVVLSRFPFADLNGDLASQLSDTPFILPDAYNPGGTGGIRGWQIAEIDLPDDTYAGDLVIGNSHLKSGGAASDHDERILAAQNIAYYSDYLFNGAGTGLPDPHGKITDVPAATSILGATTPLITGGDWNEDETKNGATKGPADWISKAALADAAGGGDGTDRDRTDMLFDDARDVFTNSPATESSSKLDYFAWQDSIATLRRAFLFNSASLPSNGVATPPELASFSISFQLASGLASDHRPVIADFILPLAECNDAVDLGCAKPGAGGLVPRFTVCGSLGTGQQAVFTLKHAPPFVTAVPIAGLGAGALPFAGGTLVPVPPIVLSGLLTGFSGQISLAVGGGGGPFDLVVQWVVLDPGATFGKSLSNALRISWLP